MTILLLAGIVFVVLTVIGVVGLLFTALAAAGQADAALKELPPTSLYGGVVSAVEQQVDPPKEAPWPYGPPRRT
jgi:hypothetical protein